MNALTKIIAALTISALAGLVAMSLSANAEPAPAPSKCTAVLAPGESC